MKTSIYFTIIDVSKGFSLTCIIHDDKKNIITFDEKEQMRNFEDRNILRRHIKLSSFNPVLISYIIYIFYIFRKQACYG